MNKQEMVQALLQADIVPCHPEWRRHLHNLTRDLLQRNPEEFLDFQAIKETMFVGNAEYTHEQLKYLTYKIDMNELIDCDVFSQHHQHPRWTTTGNTIHHRYHLFMLEEAMDIKINSLSSILELGGGYGNMARLIHRMGFEGDYNIIDLPEFQILQQYYLSYQGVPANWNIKLEKEYDLFMATWSLSEIPLADRVQYESLDVAFFLLAYGPNYGDIDNKEYFKHFMLCYPNHKFLHFKAPYQDNQYYIIGAKK